MGSGCKAERMGTQDRLRYEAERSVSLHGPRMPGARRADSVSDVSAELVAWRTEEVADIYGWISRRDLRRRSRCGVS